MCGCKRSLLLSLTVEVFWADYPNTVTMRPSTTVDKEMFVCVTCIPSNWLRQAHASILSERRWAGGDKVCSVSSVCLSIFVWTFHRLPLLFNSFVQPNPSPNPNLNHNVPNPNLDVTSNRDLPQNLSLHLKIYRTNRKHILTLLALTGC